MMIAALRIGGALLVEAEGEFVNDRSRNGLAVVQAKAGFDESDGYIGGVVEVKRLAVAFARIMLGRVEDFHRLPPEQFDIRALALHRVGDDVSHGLAKARGADVFFGDDRSLEKLVRYRLSIFERIRASTTVAYCGDVCNELAPPRLGVFVARLTNAL